MNAERVGRFISDVAAFLVALILMPVFILAFGIICLKNGVEFIIDEFKNRKVV